LRQTPRAVTPFGGLSVCIEFLKGIGFPERVVGDMPVCLKSNNAIPAGETFRAFLVAVVAGARRFAHSSMLRAGRALHTLLGMKRFATDGTIRNLFKRFTQGMVAGMYEPLWAWPLERLAKREAGYSLDLDSTVFERYGRQEGARKGCNPKKHGRASHHPLLAVLGEAHFILHGWLRSGNTAAGRGAVKFLKEALAKLPGREWIRVVRADAGFFDQELLRYLEQSGLSYIAVARLTRWLKQEAARVQEWRALDAVYAVGEFQFQLWGWDRARRFVVAREEIRENKPSLGRKLLDLPGYTFRILVTNRPDPPAEIWRDYNQRACMEQRIEELKSDLAADDFCLQEFYATEAAFLGILMLFNLLAEFQRAVGMNGYRQPASLRAQAFLCGAILGRAGHQTVLHLSAAWGGLENRNSLFDNLLEYLIPTSRKLEIQPEATG
ncbi:MAG: IS1380 family transposase, partial [Terriglobia bacterium]